MASTTILSIMMLGHKHSRTAALVRALATLADDLAVLVHLVELENVELDLLLLMLGLLRGCVLLLLSLLAAAAQTEDEMEGGFLLDVVVGKRAPVFELFPGED